MRRNACFERLRPLSSSNTSIGDFLMARYVSISSALISPRIARPGAIEKNRQAEPANGSMYRPKDPRAKRASIRGRIWRLLPAQRRNALAGSDGAAVILVKVYQSLILKQKEFQSCSQVTVVTYGLCPALHLFLFQFLDPPLEKLPPRFLLDKRGQQRKAEAFAVLGACPERSRRVSAVKNLTNVL